ncbi:MAG: hypothetical protein ACO35D_05595 [Aquiluna sp.]
MFDRSVYFEFEQITDHGDGMLEGWVNGVSALVYEMDPGDKHSLEAVTHQGLYPCHCKGSGDYVVEYSDLWRIAKSVGWENFTPPPEMAHRLKRLQSLDGSRLLILAMQYRLVGEYNSSETIEAIAAMAGLLEPTGWLACNTRVDITKYLEG